MRGLAHKLNEDELAFVIGHEYGHRHPMDQSTITRLYGREAIDRIPPAQLREIEADRIAVTKLWFSGIDMRASVRALEKLPEHGGGGPYETHPSGDWRIETLRERMRSLCYDPRGNPACK